MTWFLRRTLPLAAAVLLLVHLCTAVVEVELDIGRVVGVSRVATSEFLGIPYAQAPRWKPPVGLADTPLPSNPFLATEFGPCCPQRDAGLYIPEMDEECLSLNVYAPSEPTEELHPVLFWIYGGGGTTGCSAQAFPPLYNGTNLIERAPSKVVVVSINYRLAVLSRLYLSELTVESDEYPTAGNYHMLDIMSALQWVHRHIDRFGGDASRITIFGESAGGNLAVELGAARGADGLYRRVISESSTALQAAGWAPVEDALAVGRKFVEASGCAGDSEQEELACMRAMPALELIEAVQGVEAASPDASIVDGWLFEAYPGEAVRGGSYAGVDVMIGHNWPDNWPLCAGSPNATSEFAMKWAEIVLPLWGVPRELAPKFARDYGLDQCQPSPGRDGCCFQAQNMMLDYMMVCNAHRLLRSLSRRSSTNLYWYLMDCSPSCPASDGVCQHTSEIAYVFGTESSYQSSEDPQCSWNDGEQALSDSVISSWVGFAAAGNAGSSWTPYRRDSAGFGMFSQDAESASFRMRPFGNEHFQHCRSWDDLEDGLSSAKFGSRN